MVNQYNLVFPESDGILVLNDNARPHTALKKRKTIVNSISKFYQFRLIAQTWHLRTTTYYFLFEVIFVERCKRHRAVAHTLAVCGGPQW
uniref:Uncharacterized protein n=1 Tax=Caenorhabditis japonica TaxID=281687 RepID=A0A8R1DX01_CAEJA